MRKAGTPRPWFVDGKTVRAGSAPGKIILQLPPDERPADFHNIRIAVNAVNKMDELIGTVRHCASLLRERARIEGRPLTEPERIAWTRANAVLKACGFEELSARTGARRSVARLSA